MAVSFCILPCAPRKSKGKTVYIKCSCGRCPECKRRKANHKYYRGRHANESPKTDSWVEKYELKFKDPTYYEPNIRGPQSSFALVIEALIGRGEARRTAKHPGCE